MSDFQENESSNDSQQKPFDPEDTDTKPTATRVAKERSFSEKDLRDTYDALTSYTPPRQVVRPVVVVKASQSVEEITETTEEIGPKKAKELSRHHKSWVLIWRAPVGVALATIAAFMLFPLLGTGLEWMVAQGGMPMLYEDWFHLWLPLAATVAAVVLSIWFCLPDIITWMYWRLIITEDTVRIKFIVPGVFKNMIARVEDSDETIFRSDVKLVKISQQWYEELLRYSTVSLETFVQVDQAFHNLDYLTGVKRIRKIFGVEPDTKKSRKDK